MVGIMYVCVYVDTVFGFYRYFFFFFFFFLLLTWMFEHDCLDTCSFGCLMHVSYLHMFCAIEHVSRGKAL